MISRRLLTIGIVVAAVAIYCEWVSPLRHRERKSQTRIADLKAQIATAGTEIDDIQGKAPLAAATRAEFEGLKRNRPADSALVWFPRLIERHFSGLSPVTRYNTAKSDPRLPGMLRTYWAVEVPMKDRPGEIGKLLDALAQFEKAEPDARVTLLATRRERENPGQRSMAITVSMMVRE